MTPRERVLKALRFERVDRVPFTAYGGMAPQCAVERGLRNRGMCIKRGAPVFRAQRPDWKETHRYYEEDGKRLLRIAFEGPEGTLTLLKEPAGFTSWTHEKMFKTPDDYRVLGAFLDNERYEPCYGEFAAAQSELGEDVFLHAGIGMEPMQTFVSGDIFRMEDFCIEWMERRDEVLKLYDIVVRRNREIYPIVADSPARFVHYGGNVVPEITGPEMFEKYYLPHYAEAWEALHPKGILLASHLDANCGVLRRLIARAKLDCIEAFTPSPTTDMTLGEARAAWPDKILWLNFPSQTHLKSDAEVERATVDLLDEVPRVEGIIMGLTETVPADRWQGSFPAIMDGLDRHARENPLLYCS